MAISINQFKNGLTLLIDGSVFQVIDLQHVKPGKGAAFVRTKLRNLRNDAIIERTFRGDEKVEEAFVEERKLQYLYHKDVIYHFMDQETFEESTLSKDVLKDKTMFLKDSLEVITLMHKGEVLDIILPNSIDLKVVYTEGGIKGDTVKAGTKQATLETGAAVQVPLFIETGDIIKVDTRTHEYIERINL